MNVNFKNSVVTILILVIIGILLLFNYYYFKLSPTMIYDRKDKEILQLFEEDNNLSDLNLESRYALDEVYYSAVDDDLVYFFLSNGELVLTVDKNKLNYEKALDTGMSIFNESDIKVELAIYKEEPVYVLVSDNYDVFVDFDNYKEVFRYRKGIGNE